LETHSSNPGPRVSTFLQPPPRTAIGAPQSPAPHHSPSSPASDRADSRRAAPPAARSPAPFSSGSSQRSAGTGCRTRPACRELGIWVLDCWYV
uniref:Uncharacterized protein n=1 Tax=Aegilops tauschii subsp. strangulata TaxID=200361 RepID=A0A453GH98_AEGTS